MILIVIILLFGFAPFGFGNEPGSLDCASAAQGADITDDECDEAGGRGAWLGSPSSAAVCDDLVGSLLMENRGAVVLVNPETLAVHRVPLSPETVRIVERGWSRLGGVVPARWNVVRTSDGPGQRITVYERQTGEGSFDVAFARRIELSTVIVSSTGRFTVHIQANNIASEVTILDAQSGSTRRLDLHHDARLAAFAIGGSFSPNETWAAISMERVGGNGPETWLLDLETGHVRQLPVEDAFVLAWTRYQV